MLRIAQLELTLRCNQSCLYCYNPDCLKSAEEISNDEWLNIINDLQAERIVLTGGEPFLRKDLVFRILEANRDKLISINTNLRVPNREDLDRLAELKTPLMVSVTSTEREVYQRIRGRDDLTQVLESVAYLSERGIPPTINMVVLPETIGQVIELGMRMKDLGVRTFFATPVEGDKVSGLDERQTIEVLDYLLALKERGLRVGVARPLPYCIIPKDEAYDIFLTRHCGIDKGQMIIGTDGKRRSCVVSTERLRISEPCNVCETLEKCGGGCRAGNGSYVLKSGLYERSVQTFESCHDCVSDPCNA